MDTPVKKIADKADFYRRFCWLDGLLYLPGEHRCAMGAKWGRDLPVCHDSFSAGEPDDQKQSVSENWEMINQRKEWMRA